MADAMPTPPIITLTTDFGAGSRYVAAMKGVILSINSRVQLVDLSHAIPHQDIRAGAIVLAETAPWFPPETIHIAVVDPGVGSTRRILYARYGSQQFIAPDNGLLSGLALRERASKIVSIDEPRFWLPEVSHTFHGRDIMAPIAARLSTGLSPDATSTFPGLRSPCTTCFSCAYCTAPASCSKKTAAFLGGIGEPASMSLKLRPWMRSQAM